MAKFDQPIPKELEHLKRDARNFPIPFFVGYKNGEPDFRLLDARKQKQCVEERLCAICGKKLPKDYVYFLSGILGMTNQVSSDPPMHKECAVFSLRACPHLHYEKADRRDTGLALGEISQKLLELKKPKNMYLIRATKFKMKWTENQPLIHYHYESHQQWAYQDGVLQAVGPQVHFTAIELKLTGLQAKIENAPNRTMAKMYMEELQILMNTIHKP